MGVYAFTCMCMCVHVVCVFVFACLAHGQLFQSHCLDIILFVCCACARVRVHFVVVVFTLHQVRGLLAYCLVLIEPKRQYLGLHRAFMGQLILLLPGRGTETQEWW